MWGVYGVIALLLGSSGWAGTKNGFDVTDALVAAAEIRHGGPPKDGIPALYYPHFVGSLDADFLQPADRILGLVMDQLPKAYPVKILNYHEVVNDRIAMHRYVVSYCPLCGSGVAFQAPEGQVFGVSGLLYNSDVLLYDRKTESLWSQLMARAISGPLKGTPLIILPLQHTTWKQWQAQHPDTLVLSNQTGYPVNYDRTPYPGYEKHKRLLFPVSHRNRQFSPKQRVLGVTLNGRHRAYPLSELVSGEPPLIDRFQGHTLKIQFDPEQDTAWIEPDPGGRLSPDFSAVLAYWFAWYAFHPETEVWTRPYGPAEHSADADRSTTPEQGLRPSNH